MGRKSQKCKPQKSSERKHPCSTPCCPCPPGTIGPLVPAHNTAVVDPTSVGIGVVGDLSKPFLTVNAALLAVLSLKPSQNNAFTILLRPGQYREKLILPGWIDLIGSGSNTTRIIDPHPDSIPIIELTGAGPSTIQGIGFDSFGSVIIGNNTDDIDGSLRILRQNDFHTNFPESAVDPIENGAIAYPIILTNGRFRFFDNTAELFFNSDDTVSAEGFALVMFDAGVEIESNKIQYLSTSHVRVSTVLVLAHKVRPDAYVRNNNNTVDQVRLTGVIPEINGKIKEVR